MLTRRSLLWGLIAAPAVVKATSLMPVKLFEPMPTKIMVPFLWDDALVTYERHTYSTLDSLLVRTYSKALIPDVLVR
jgi:hypothetical protein